MNNIYVFEGIDFCGKGTQIQMLHQRFLTNAILLREPGGTVAGESIRKVFLEAKTGAGLDNISRTLLLFAARKQLIEEKIRPVIFGANDDRPIIMDRFFFSTFAYQWSMMESRREKELIEYLTRLIVSPVILSRIHVFHLKITYEEFLARRNARAKNSS